MFLFLYTGDDERAPPTLDGPLEESLAGLAGRHTVVIPGGEVSAHQTQPFGPHGPHRGHVVAPQDRVDLQIYDVIISGEQ